MLLGVLQMSMGWAQASGAYTDHAHAMWQVSTWTDEQSVSDGLPVLALDRADWYLGLAGVSPTYRAQRQLQGGLEATHPTGWRMGVLARSFAHLQATEDAVALAALVAQKVDPEIGVVANVAARSKGWNGKGLSLGSPWIPLMQSSQWRWRADAQWLQLEKVRQNQLEGQIAYQAGAYDVHVNADRWGNQISGPFLSPSGRTGWGGSLSLALEGEPAPNWYVGIRANDIWSRLHWGSLTREISLINSQVTSRNPDGSLNYSALINGKQSLEVWQKNMGVRWQFDARRTIQGEQGELGALTWNSINWEGLNQHWLGWASPVGAQGTAWLVALEPRRYALSGGLKWRGLTVAMATDGKSKSQTQYRSWLLRWDVPL